MIFRDFFFKDSNRAIRIAHCELLTNRNKSIMNSICSLCPIHQRFRTDLFCVYHRDAYDDLCRIAETNKSYDQAYLNLVLYMKKRYPH